MSERKMSKKVNDMSLVVSLGDFNNRLKLMRYGAKLGKGNIAAEEVEFVFDGNNLVIYFIGAVHTIPAKGHWKGAVMTALPFIGRLRRAPPTQNPLTISYENSRLKIGTTSISATWVP